MNRHQHRGPPQSGLRAYLAYTLILAGLLALAGLFTGCAKVCYYPLATVLEFQQAKGPLGRSLADYPQTCGTVAILPWNAVGRPGTPSAPVYAVPWGSAD